MARAARATRVDQLKIKIHRKSSPESEVQDPRLQAMICNFSLNLFLHAKY